MFALEESPHALTVKYLRIVSPPEVVPFAYPFLLQREQMMKEFESGKTIVEKRVTPSGEGVNEKADLYDLLIHDLTGPLAIVSTSANNLLYKADRYGPLTDFQKRLLERILRNVHRAQNLIQEMIEVLRSEEGLFQKEYFPIETTLREALLDVLEIAVPHAVQGLCQVENQEAFQHGLKEHGIFIEITGKYCHDPFCHDQKKVQQILRNLISNAMKYRRERMEVKISGEVDLVVSIEDDGIGISPEDQEVIFKRFVRLSDEKCAYVSGLGLGLTGVKTLVEAMGGEITLESQKGRGTRFIVRIPPILLQSDRNKGEAL